MGTNVCAKCLFVRQNFFQITKITFLGPEPGWGEGGSMKLVPSRTPLSDPFAGGHSLVEKTFDWKCFKRVRFTNFGVSGEPRRGTPRGFPSSGGEGVFSEKSSRPSK